MGTRSPARTTTSPGSPEHSWSTRNAPAPEPSYLSAGPAEDAVRLGLPRPRHPGGLIVVDAAPVLAPGDIFRPEIYVRALEAAVDAALRDGFAGAHLLVEGGWSLAAIRDVESGGSSRTWCTSSACCSEGTRSWCASSIRIVSRPRRWNAPNAPTDLGGGQLDRLHGVRADARRTT